MRKVLNRTLRLSLTFFLVISVALSLCSCFDFSADYATGHLEEYGVPHFDKAKFREVERIYMYYYVEELPSAEDMAAATAEIYFEKYHENIDTGSESDVTEALIKSYVESIGDKYSIYRSAAEYEIYDTEMSGTFYGIGVLVQRSAGDVITVIEVYSESGAKEAGILPGDVICAVAGQEVTEIGYPKAVDLIRGEEFTRVDVTVERNGERTTLSVERRRIVEKSVTYSINEDKIGYVKISSFKGNTDELFMSAIDELKELGAVGIIYDLRANPGGYLDSVVSALSYIAPDNTRIVSFSNDYGSPRKDNNSHELYLPSVVICDENTASAGELFTAAMRDFDETLGYFDVTLVGETTYGKGIMQTTLTLSDRSTITLTVAYYNPPSGINYHGSGIVPDVIVADSESGDAQLDAAYEEIEKLIKK